jgi:hypothetical protein
MKRIPWDPTLDAMIAELRTGDSRAQVYWAQQLAFGPVLVHALRLRFRAEPPPAALATLLGPCVHLACAGLSALPELEGGDPTSLRLLAQRQARALSWGRRRTLARLLSDLNTPPAPDVGIVPPRMTRPYPLLGFRPDERLAG